LILVSLVVAAGLALVAATGILHPFRRGRAASLEHPADPLDDERQSLLRALRDLDQERAIGLLTDSDHRSLRTETERRAVAVLRTIEARDGAGTLAADLAEIRTSASPEANGGPAPRKFGALPALLVGVAVLGAVVPLLIGAIRSRSADQPISGTNVAGQSPLHFYQDRVRQFPHDLAARLDLANAYLQTGDIANAVAQYLEALKVDPKNPEARATLGFLLYRSGHPQEGLDAVNQALVVMPDFPEALYFKGVILLDGLHRPGDAAVAFRAYLAAAPFDSASRREDAQKRLAQAEHRGSSQG
jgi:cytochrome c-type biogenesis protein CcmH/NrfG